MYCIKINSEWRHWKSYAHKPGHVQNVSGSQKNNPKRWRAVGWGGKATTGATKVVPDTCGGKILFKVNQQSRKTRQGKG